MALALMHINRMALLRRKHRHIVEVGLSSLLSRASMPLKFWDEAFIAATYLINRIPTKLLNYSTPLETLFHEKPDYSALRIFGCACWPNLRPYNTRKLEFRSKRCAFVGYSNFHKGFKCLDISTGRVYISKDVVFDESVFPFSELHPNAGALLRSEILLLPPELLVPFFALKFYSFHLNFLMLLGLLRCLITCIIVLLTHLTTLQLLQKFQEHLMSQTSVLVVYPCL
jgi:glycosyltransferase involved in cell wall biosynthesis